ncbi:MAG: response regulator transcription factor [Chitinophagales bacterium]|jgi:two-component system LytT family response regulator|nr:response regulator transcription factor [Chitinophagales bacterium]
MLKTVIVDDDFRDRDILKQLLERYCPDEVEVAGSASNVAEAFLLIAEKKPGLVFLDIELGSESGFDLLKKFTQYPFRVIFATAHDQYAIQAIKFNALDYLLKPIEIAELVNAVQKVKESGHLSLDAELKNLVENLAHPHHKSNRVAIPVSNGYKMISVESILFCEAKKEYTYIHCRDQPTICSSVNLGEYEMLLANYSFCRVHHSFLVNKEHVKQYNKGEGGELLLENNMTIPVSRRKKQEVLEWLKVA